MEKLCSKCRIIKPLTDFTTKKTAKDGRHSFCKKCMCGLMHKAYERNPSKFIFRTNQARKKIRDWVNQIKQSRGCMICPEKEVACLDFHHKNPHLKTFTIKELVDKKNSQENILAEISKCVVLCANCHRKVHAGILTIGV